MSGRRHLYLLIYLNTLIMKKHQYGSLFDYMNEGLGKWAGNIVNLMICLYFIGVASFEARAMAEMVKFFLLERTPVPVTLFIFIACSVYLIIGGMSDIGRLFPFYLTITIIILLVVFSFSFKIFDLDNLRPVLGQGFSPVMASLTVVSVSFLGIEIMLFLPEYLKIKAHIPRVGHGLWHPDYFIHHYLRSRRRRLNHPRCQNNDLAYDRALSII